MSVATHTLPPGLRIYAIGDIHGRFDLLRKLEEKIAEDAKSMGGVVQIIFLGDYIDRGMHSRETVDYLITRQKQEVRPPIFLLGNHEKVLLSVLKDQDTDLLLRWMHFGGRETLLSYGVKSSSFSSVPGALIAELAEKIPMPHMSFLNSLQLSVSYGDYFFCHAGVRPGIPLEEQDEEDLLWIRQEFLECDEPFEKMVVHGHSISPEAEFQHNRIGIDTGAYATHRLTALGLEGTKQWLLQTE